MPDEKHEGMDLRDAIRGVDSREIIGVLDSVRDDPKVSREFITHLAKENPTLFLKYAGEVLGSGEHEYAKLLREGKYLEAIKLYRAKTGSGLKECKQFMDALREKIGIKV